MNKFEDLKEKEEGEMEVLINHPAFGSMWLSGCRIENGIVSGWRHEIYLVSWAQYHYEKCWYNFPISCIRRKETTND